MQTINESYVKEISKKKNEPKWMLDFRLKALKTFNELDNPTFGPKLNIDFNQITYYKDKVNNITNDWNKVDENVRDTFCSLGVVKAEQEYLYGVTNQFESEVIYHNIKDSNSKVIFTSTDEALQKYPELPTLTVLNNKIKLA